MNVKVTVFTPTYNRAYIIEKLYRSLQRQTCKEFEWLIVDDGSSDNTELLFKEWMNDNNSFSIRYYKKENGGKCRAINYALDLAEGELFFTVDSDDYITDDAIEKIVMWEKDLSSDEKFCGLAGNLGTSETYTPNKLFDKQYYDGTLLDRYDNVDGERAIVLYTDIHKKYKYPEFENEMFITEAVVWNRMANDGYKMRFFNDIIWVYEYQEDGLTKAGNNLFRNNPYGYGLWLKEKAEFQDYKRSEKFKLIYSFTCELEDMYSCGQIADYINVALVYIYICKILYKVKRFIKW